MEGHSRRVRRVLINSAPKRAGDECMVLILFRFSYCTGRIGFSEDPLLRQFRAFIAIAWPAFAPPSARATSKPAGLSDPRSVRLRAHCNRLRLPSAVLLPASLLSLFVALSLVSPLHAANACAPTTFEGTVQAGQAFQHSITSGLEFKLEAVPAGWIVRIFRRSDPHDLAELANPPYRSPTPILISTDYSFRAQDAIAWNPRTFRFFTTESQLQAAARAYQATLLDPTHPSAGAALYTLLPQASQAELRILDAEIAGGTGDQTAGAAAVASHLDQTPHQVRSNLPATSLGRILSLRFRVTMSQGSAVSRNDTTPCRQISSPQHPTSP